MNVRTYNHCYNRIYLRCIINKSTCAATQMNRVTRELPVLTLSPQKRQRCDSSRPAGRTEVAKIDRTINKIYASF